MVPQPDTICSINVVSMTDIIKETKTDKTLSKLNKSCVTNQENAEMAPYMKRWESMTLRIHD